jgi:hypothetical protein
VLQSFARIPAAARRALDAEASALRAFFEPIEPRVFSRYRQSAARGALPGR